MITPNPTRRTHRRPTVTKPMRNFNIAKGNSNIKQGNAAKKLFLQFMCDQYGPSKDLVRKEQLFTTEGNIKEDLVTEELLGCWGGFCQDNSATWSTAKNYYSQIKKCLEKLYPVKKSVIIEISTEIQKNITKHFKEASARDRVPMVKHHLPFTGGDNNLQPTIKCYNFLTFN